MRGPAQFSWEVMCHQYRITAPTNQKHSPDMDIDTSYVSVKSQAFKFRKETSGGITKCRIFSWTNLYHELAQKLANEDENLASIEVKHVSACF